MTKARVLSIATLAIAATVPTLARADDVETVAAARKTLEELMSKPNTGVPASLLRTAEGVIVVPRMINGGLIVGAKAGRGVFLGRDSRGEWGNPVLVTLTGGSLGLQAGGQASEVLLVFRTKETVSRFLAGKGKITLGAEANIAGGSEVRTRPGMETDLEFRDEIFTFARNRGLYAGASLAGAAIRVDRNSNAFFYDHFSATTLQIIDGDDVTIPAEAAKLKALMIALTEPPAKGREAKAPRDAEVARSSRTVRKGANADDEDTAPPSGRPSTRRRKAADAEGDDAPPPTTKRPRAKTPPPPDDDPDDPAPPRSTRKARPATPPPPDDDPDAPPLPTTPKQTARMIPPDDPR